MKKSNKKTSGRKSAADNKTDQSETARDKEVDQSEKTREKYHKEIVQSKVGNNENNKESSDVVEEKDDPKFTELRKYLLSDIQGEGIKGSSPVKTSPAKSKGKSQKKNKMIDTRGDLLPAPDKSVTEMSSPEKQTAEGKNAESTIIQNGDQTPSKRLKLTKSPTKLEVPAPESPRVGSRQRSPNVRYADDVVMFSKKSPKRQIFKKEGTENSTDSTSPTVPTSTSSSADCQTSQLYSLLTGNVVSSTKTDKATKSPSPNKNRSKNEKQKEDKNNLTPDNKKTRKSRSPTKSVKSKESSPVKSVKEMSVNASAKNDIEKPESEIQSIEKDQNEKETESESKGKPETDLDNVENSMEVQNDEIEETSIMEEPMKSDQTELDKDTAEAEPMESAETYPDKQSAENEPMESSETKFEKQTAENEPMKSSETELDINCNSGDKVKSTAVNTETESDPLENLSKVIDQILVEAVQDEMPDWAVYRYRGHHPIRKRRKPIASKDDDIKTQEEETNLDCDDLKNKRRLTKPISKRSMIKMSPALGLLVGHDEKGFRPVEKTSEGTEDEVKKEDVDSNQDTKTSDIKKEATSLLGPTMQRLTNSPSTKSSTVLSTHPQIKLLTNPPLVGTKATIVSGSQAVPCVLVPASSTNVRQPKLYTIPGSALPKNSLVIPASQISLISTTGALRFSSATPNKTTMVSMLTKSPIIRPGVRLATPMPRTVYVSPKTEQSKTLSSARIRFGQALSTSAALQQKHAINSSTVIVSPTTTSSATLPTKNNTGPAQVFCLGANGQLQKVTSNSETLTTTLLTSSTASMANGTPIPANSKVLILKKSEICTTTPHSQPVVVNQHFEKDSPVVPNPTDKPTESEQVEPESKPEVKKVVKKDTSVLDNLISRVMTNMDSKPQLPDMFASDVPSPYTEESDDSEDDNSDVSNDESFDKDDDDAKREKDDKEKREEKGNKQENMTRVEVEEEEMKDEPSDLKSSEETAELKHNYSKLNQTETSTSIENEVMEVDEKAEQILENNDEKQLLSKSSEKDDGPKSDTSNDNSKKSEVPQSDEPEKENGNAINNSDQMKPSINSETGLKNSDSQKTSETLKENTNLSHENMETIQEQNNKHVTLDETVSIEVKVQGIDSGKEVNKFETGKEQQDSQQNSETEKEQPNSLQSKLKKAMLSLSNVKSVLAAKADLTKYQKGDSKTEGTQKVPTVEENSEHDTDLSDAEDSDKRRNIFDIMMDFQSPNKEGKSPSRGKYPSRADKSPSRGKSPIRADKSPSRAKSPSNANESQSREKSPSRADNSSSKDENCEMSKDQKSGELKEKEELPENPQKMETETEKEEDEKLPDIGLKQKDEGMKSDLANENKMEEQEKENDETTDSEKMDISESAEKETTNDEKVESKSSESPDANETLNDENNLTRIDISDDNMDDNDDNDDIQIIKIQDGDESEVEELENQTIVDKLMARFKKWDDEENHSNKTENKLSLKLKITSSPNKSVVVSSHGSRKNLNMRKVDGRLVPMNSTQQEVKEPLSMKVLSKPEAVFSDKRSAFTSDILDSFLENEAVEIKDEEEDDDENEDENSDENDSDMSMDENEPDFDEIDGVLFMSFPSKNALKAHVNVERRTKLGTDENMLLGMTRMRNMRKQQGYILSKYRRKLGNQVFKEKENINQNFRGMHKTLAKYQRLYKQELYWLENPADDGSGLGKTSDITKIKGWKNKVDGVTDVEQAKAEIENGGKLHWRTEARLAKNLKPDELKEFGLNIKKKRRKNIIYTQRKGMSKGDRSHRTDNDLDDDLSRSSEIQFIDDEAEEMEFHEDQEENQGEGHPLEDENDLIMFDPDDNVQDEELVRIYERELLKDDDKIKMRERNRMLFKSQNLRKHLHYNLQDLQVIRKLGGLAIRRKKNLDGEYEGEYQVMTDSGSRSRPTTPEISQLDEIDTETPPKKSGKSTSPIIMTSGMAKDACNAIPKKYARKKPKTNVKSETGTPNRSPDPGQSSTCDKPDCDTTLKGCCRYGCICHLCTFTDQSPEADSNTTGCEKEYCRLGCICDSIDARNKGKAKKPHCGKPECVLECLCIDLTMDEKKDNKDDMDYCYSKQKKNPKFATLPRRESTYRLAKNLDAVSRKAMLYYESSEMFVDQKKRRRKSKESEMAPEVYMDIDIDDYDPTQNMPQAPFKPQKPDHPIHKPIPQKSKSPVGGGPIKTDFSDIQSTISSKGNWKKSILVDEMSDEYDESCLASDDENSSCARTNVYKTVHRERPHPASCTCSSHKAKTNDDGKFNIPQDLLSSGKWHTQWICLRSKGHADQAVENLRLLEVISNCNYEDMKAKILSCLTTHISGYRYPALVSFIVPPFKVSILPKSSKPAVIPPEVKAKLPKHVYSVRIQIVKDESLKQTNIPVINLTDDQDDEVNVSKMSVPSKPHVKSVSQSIRSDIATSALAKQLQMPVTQSMKSHASSSVVTQSNPSSQSKTTGGSSSTISQHLPMSKSIVSGGIGGLSRLNISQPTGHFAIVNKPPGLPIKTASSIPDKQFTASLNTIPNSSSVIIVSKPINVLASSAVTSVTSSINQQKPYVSLGSGEAIKGVTSVVPESADQQNLKRKLPMQTTIMIDLKKSRLDPTGQVHIEKSGQVAQPIVPSGAGPIIQTSAADQATTSNVDDSIGQISVLKCVKCSAVLTTEDITSWVLSQDSISDKICVRCRGPVPIPKIVTPVVQTEPIVIDLESSPVKDQIPTSVTSQGEDILNTFEKGFEKIQNIVQEDNDDEKGKESKDETLVVLDETGSSNSKTDNKSAEEKKDEIEDDYDTALLDNQDDDNIARSLSEDEPDSQKSNVIVIDDEEENSNSSNIPRSKVEDQEVDVTGLSEMDSFDIASTSGSESVSSWHSSSCSLHSNLQKKRKRKAPLDVIENKQADYFEVQEGFLTEEEKKLYKKMKEKKRRVELQSNLEEIASLLFSQEEASRMKRLIHFDDKQYVMTKCGKILAKATDHLKKESNKCSLMEKRVKSLKAYQENLMKRLEDLKDFHIKRGISREKLDFQLQKIAVVCDRIYDHLPEIKQHIKKKRDDSSNTSTPQSLSPVKNTPQKTPQPTDTPVIYIDNPEESDNEVNQSTSGTPVSSLPGSYSATGSKIPVQTGSSSASMKKQSSFQPILPKLVSSVVIAQGSSQSIFPPSSMQQSNLGLVPSSPCTAQASVNIHNPHALTMQLLIDSEVENRLQCLSKDQSSGAISASRTQTTSSALGCSVNNQVNPSAAVSQTSNVHSPGNTTGQNLGQTTSLDFHAVVDKILKQNIDMGDDKNEPMNKNEAEKEFENNFKSFDENLLKDQILDDTTGEIINVLINEDDNENNGDSSKDGDNFQKSENEKPPDEINQQSSAENVENEKRLEISEIIKETESQDNTSNVVKKDEQSEQKDDKPDPQDNDDILSLLDDIRSLSQEVQPSTANSSFLSSSYTSTPGSSVNTSPLKNTSPKITAENKPLITQTSIEEKLDQVDGALFNMADTKETCNLSDADSNNSARTNVYMEDSDGNVSIAGEVSDEAVEGELGTPKIVSVMSISDVLGDHFKDIDEQMDIGPQGDNESSLLD